MARVTTLTVVRGMEPPLILCLKNVMPALNRTNCVGAAEDKLVYQLSVQTRVIDAAREIIADVYSASPSSEQMMKG